MLRDSIVRCERCGKNRRRNNTFQCGACHITRCFPKCHNEHLTEMRDGMLTANKECLMYYSLDMHQTHEPLVRYK